MIESLQSDVEVVSAKDGIDGLVLLKTHAEDVRLCLADMVMPGCSGIELLNRARADPSLQRVTFALMTEFSSGKDGKKTLSHFQVSDDRGDPVAVLIKPLHSALLEEMLKKLNDPEAASQAGVHRKHSQATLLNAGIDADPDWNRHRSRSDWSARHSLDVPKTQTPSPGSKEKKNRKRKRNLQIFQVNLRVSVPVEPTLRHRLREVAEFCELLECRLRWTIRPADRPRLREGLRERFLRLADRF